MRLFKTISPSSDGFIVVGSLLQYAGFVCLAILGITHLAELVVRGAVEPMASLMTLGDGREANNGRSTKPAETVSSVLESDAWLEDVKAKWQSQTRSSPGSDTERQLLGRGLPGALRLDEAAPRSRYRTVCVRLCDGYFFPISFAAPKDRFGQDQQVCERSCSSPAKLYVYQNPVPEPNQMVSLDGQPYSKLSTAFLYRTKWDQDCKCTPHPWEQEAMARHRKYADAVVKAVKADRAGQVSTKQPTPSTAAPTNGRASAKSAPMVVEEPQTPPLAAAAAQMSTAVRNTTISAATDVPAFQGQGAMPLGMATTTVAVAIPKEQTSTSETTTPPATATKSASPTAGSDLDEVSKQVPTAIVNSQMKERLSAAPPSRRPALPARLPQAGTTPDWKMNVFASR